MSDEIRGKCWHCGQGLTAVDYGREADCPACGKQTHVCRNCRFYTPGRPNDCFEPMAERVLNKERANFCGFFEPTQNPIGGTGGPPREDLHKAAEDLFKGS